MYTVKETTCMTGFEACSLRYSDVRRAIRHCPATYSDEGRASLRDSSVGIFPLIFFLIFFSFPVNFSVKEMFIL